MSTETSHGLTVEEIPKSPQTVEEEIAERFKKNTAKHEMTVLHDDGVYRRLRFRAPKSSEYWFELVTWPGSLVIRGDVDGFMFSRLPDMFEFFRGKGINPGYWAEKLEGGRDSARSFSEDLFNQRVAEALKEAEEETPGVTAAWKKATSGWLCEWDTSNEHGARAALEAFEYLPEGDKGEPFRFEDTWEWNFQDYDMWFLWACHAIVWGIAQYDAGRPATGYVAIDPTRDERVAKIRREQPSKWLPAPWVIHEVDGGPEGKSTWQVSRRDSDTVLATLPDWAGDLALWMADSIEDIPFLCDVIADQAARMERYRIRMVTAEADLQSMRGHLSPNGYPRRVPMPLGKELAPIVEWLLAENERMAAELAEFEKSVPADDGESVIA